jgi:hypothetical protein
MLVTASAIACDRFHWLSLVHRPVQQPPELVGELHRKLRQYDREVGWQRYRSAGIGVINRETGERVA